MDHQEIRRLFALTLSPDAEKRKQAEDLLSHLENNISFIMALPDTYMKDTDPNIKKIATVYFKNCVERNWESENFQEAKFNLINSIVQRTQAADLITMNYYLTIVRNILSKEEPKNISPILDQISNCIQSPNDFDVFIGINLLNTILEVDTLKYNSTVISPFFTALYSIVYEKMIYFLSKNDLKVGKLFMQFFSTLSKLFTAPEFFHDYNFFSSIFSLCKNVIGIREIRDPDTLELIDWALKLINRTIERSKKRVQKNQEIVNLVSNEESLTEIYQNCKSILISSFDNGEESEKTAYSALEVICTLLNEKKFSPYIIQDVQFFLEYFLGKLHLFSEKDEIDYETPENFLKKKYSYYIDDLRSLSLNFFDDLIKKVAKKTDKLFEVLTYLRKLLTNCKNSPSLENSRLAYAALTLIAQIASRIENSIKGETFDFIIDYILPFLNSEFNFLKGQACYALQYFEGENMENEALVFAFNKIMEFLEDEDEVLKVDAAMSCSFFLYNKYLKAKIQVLIPQLVQTLLSLSSKYDLEALSSLLECTVSNFPEEIALFAPNLMQALTTLIINTLKKDVSDAIDVVSGYLRTIETLFDTITDQGVLINMFESSFPLISSLLSNSYVDYYQEAIDICSTFVTSLKGTTKGCYVVLEQILSLSKDTIFNFTFEIANFIESLITFGNKEILLSEKYFNLIISFIENLCCTKTDDFFEEDYNYACNILIVFLLQHGEYLGDKVDMFINYALSNKNLFERESSCWVYSLNVVMHCYLINQENTFLHLRKIEFFTEFFKRLYDKRKRFQRVFDKKSVLLFCAVLFTKPYFELDYLKLAKIFVRSLKSLPSAINKRNLLKAKKDEEEFEENFSDEDMLEEDIYFVTKLDSFDVFGYLRQVVFNMQNNTIGSVLFAQMADDQKLVVQEVLNAEQPKELL